MRKGFTLIELLAVIVILAIIALIAVPIVINIINDAKESSDEQSVELYKDAVEKAITKKQLSDPNFNPDKCKIQENGNLKCYKNNELLQDEIEVDMKGKTPSDGIVEIKSNKIKFRNILFNGKKYDENYAVLIEDINEQGLSTGDEYSYDVNDTDTLNFYVLSFNNDNTVNLIMDRNICENEQTATEENKCLMQWTEYSNDVGPISAMQGLYNATKDWNNVPDMDLSGNKAYEDEGRTYAENHYDSSNIYGYGKIETEPNGIAIYKKDGITQVTNRKNQVPVILYVDDKPLKARLPKYNEITNEGTKCETNDGIVNCEWWLLNNLAPCNYYSKSVYPKKHDMLGINGYWLMSSGLMSSNTGRFMRYDGVVSSSLTNYSNAGIRPVITVPRSYLEN